LGKHPIFKQKEQFDRFLKMDVVERAILYKQTIPHRIWRIKSELKKGDKPHLDKDRKRKLMECEAQLAELHRILYPKPKE
jgi:Trm5-related predicted tRNA methylase